MFMPSLIGNPPSKEALYQNWRNTLPIRTALIHSNGRPLNTHLQLVSYMRDHLISKDMGQKKT
jgi:hypothetical protein